MVIRLSPALLAAVQALAYDRGLSAASLARSALLAAPDMPDGGPDDVGPLTASLFIRLTSDERQRVGLPAEGSPGPSGRDWSAWARRVLAGAVRPPSSPT